MIWMQKKPRVYHGKAPFRNPQFASRPPRIIILVYRATELVRYKITMRDGEDSTKMSTRTACRGPNNKQSPLC